MKKISVLKKLITIYYYLIIGAIGMVIFGVFFGGNLALKIEGSSVDFMSVGYLKATIIAVMAIMLLSLFAKAIYLLKNCFKDLENGNHFSKIVIENFKKSGTLFLLLSIAKFISKIIFTYIFKEKLLIEFSNPAFLFLIMGLFFMYLSQVFAKGKQLQEENELTI